MRKFLSKIIATAMLVTMFSTATMGTAFGATELTVSIDSVNGNKGEQIVVPVKFEGVTESGISTADMTIDYDSEKLECVSVTAGSIVTNPSTNFAANKEKDGSIKVLFLDYTMSTGYISTSGVFANLTFNVLSSSAESTKVAISSSTFGNKDLETIKAKVTGATIVLNGVAPTTAPTAAPTTAPTVAPPTAAPTASTAGFTVNVDSVKGNNGDKIVVPINFANVPSNGISTAGMTISYDATKLEYICGEAGSVIKNPTTDFAINNSAAGILKVLFLDYSMSTGFISTDGVFAKLEFKVISSASGNSTIALSNTTFADKDLVVVIPEINEGKVTIGNGVTEKPTATPTIVPTATPTATPTAVPTATPTATPTAVPTATPTAVPTATPTAVPTATPTAVPTATPTAVPTATPTAVPTATPTAVPTATPTAVPTATPTAVPTATPTAVPTATPTAVPTATPTVASTATPTPTVVPTVAPTATGFSVNIDSLVANKGEVIVVPVYLTNVPASGISTADMTIDYDRSKLEFVDSEAGSIVTNPSVNFAINNVPSKGKINALFLDYTMDDGYIRTSGVFAKLTFKVLDTASGTTTIKVSKATFGDKNLETAVAKMNAGIVTIGNGENEQPTATPTAATPTPTTAASATPTPTATPTATPTTTATPTGNFSVSYNQTSWGTGATVCMIIKNNGATAVNGWTVDYTYSGNQKIVNAWNCEYTQSGNSVKLTNVSYNAFIPAGESVTIGFNLSYSGTNTAPTNFTVNAREEQTQPVNAPNVPNKPTAPSTPNAPSAPTAPNTKQPTTKPNPKPQSLTKDCSVSYSQTSWGAGSTVSMTIKNNGSSAVNGWTINYSFAGDQKILNSWNCGYTQSGSSVKITNLKANESIPAGGSVKIGFNMAFSGENKVPTDFTVEVGK